ncbi:MAG: polymer-forming cytoskeletal protein [Candidatus Cloacimonetes bacterium]|nr:polymer-forming cytoskeletal protein [Candidatus Cloacimonadota bacterium]
MKKMSDSLNTIIGKDTKMIGEIYSNGSIRIDGKVEGKIEAKGSLTIGPTANVKADIKSIDATISGVVNGNIVVENKLELLNKSQVKGDIITKVLCVEIGAKINGNCNMGTEVITNLKINENAK